MAQTRSSFPALTGIRAIAAIMVFAYHHRKFWYQLLPEWVSRLLNEFNAGVSLFFVLSGFLIAYTYGDKPLQNKGHYLRYLLIRMARIFPIYLLLLSVKYIDLGFPDSFITFLTYTLWQGFSDKLNLHGIPQAWSLTVELSFYTLAPLIYYLSGKSIAKTFGFLLLLLLLTIGIGYGWHWVNGNRYSFFYPWYFVLNTTFSGRFMEFMAGILLAHFIQQQKFSFLFPNKHITIIGLSSTLVCLIVIAFFQPDLYHSGTDATAGLLIRNLLLPFCFMWVLQGLIVEKNLLQRFLSTRLMVLLGNASFVFYLIHINYINSKLTSWHLFPDRNFILLWLVSVLIYLVIEKPLYMWLRKLIKL